MNYCKNCQVHYDTPLETCIFCNSELEKSSDSHLTVYKFNPFLKKRVLPIVYRIFVFLNLISIGLSLYVDYDVSRFPLTWSIIVSTSNLYAILLFTIFYKEGTWISKVNKSVFSGLLWIAAISYGLGDYHWAVDYIIPFSIIFNISLLTLLLIIDQKKWFDYATGLFFFSFIGLIPGLLNLLRLTDVRWPSAVSVIYAIVTLIGMLFFTSKETKDEFKRRFHV